MTNPICPNSMGEAACGTFRAKAGFFLSSADCGIHSPLGQFSRLAKMTTISLGVGCERKSDVLKLGLACKPSLLFRHRGGIRGEKGKSIKNAMEIQIIYSLRLRLVDDLACLVEVLQGNGAVGEIGERIV